MSSSNTDDLRGYYEEEARQQTRSDLVGRRVELRDAFAAQLRQEGCRSVVDFGAGPGHDGSAFRQAGFKFVGIDLAHGNGLLASGRSVAVLQGSLIDPPFADGAFDAGWSMSTLMHLPATDAVVAIAGMARCLRPGAPLLVGQWGGELGDHIDDQRLPGQRRLFSMRPFDVNRDMMASVGSIERAEVWDAGPAGWEYHVVVVRVADTVDDATTTLGAPEALA